MLKCLLLVSVLLSVSAISSAKKMILPIEGVAATADIIVAGEIISVGNGFYNFKVSETIKGNHKPVITIQQFREWTCDIRYAKAAKGQQLFLFLKKINGKLELVNGSSGELPVINNKVKLVNESPDYKIYRSRPYQLDFEEFKSGIKGFIHLFAMIENNTDNHRVYFRQKGKEGELQKFIANGGFSKWIYEKLQMNYTIIKS